MESQPQNAEFRYNPENFHPWKQATEIRMRNYLGKIEMTLYVTACL